MDILVDSIGNATVIRLKGALNRSGRKAAEKQVMALVEAGRNLALDFSEVTFISSAGFQFLFELDTTCKRAGARLALTGFSDVIRETMSMVGMMQGPLPIYDTLEEGLSRFRTRRASMDREELEELIQWCERDIPKRPRSSFDIPKMQGEEEDVKFSAYYPKELAISKWYTLLVYTFVPSALEAVRRDAEKFKAEIGEMRETKTASPTKLARGTDITIVPACEGVTFNPERVTFKWLENHHRAQFRMRADASLADMARNGTVTVYVGPVIVATLKMGVLFNETEAGPSPVRSEENVTRMYRQDEIFMSYSHHDTDIVLNCKQAYQALGFTVLIDRETLRSGQKWNDELLRMIERADIFQLFWSENSSKSDYCRQEWQHALQCDKGTGFIRPVYWHEPIPEPPSELSDLHFDYAPFVVQG